LLKRSENLSTLPMMWRRWRDFYRT